MRTVTVAFALALAATPAYALTPDEAKAATTRIDAPKLKEHVERLSAPEMQGRRAGSSGAKLAVEYLAKTFAEVGLGPLPGESALVVQAEGSQNVLGRIPGSDRAAEAIVISAHWDGIGVDGDGKLVPGADENASGVAALLELARTLGRSRPRRTLVFAAFGGWWDAKEDSARFRGSSAFAARYGSKDSPLRPVFAVNLMGLGVPLVPTAPERFFALGSESSPALHELALGVASEVKDLKLACASIDLIEKRGPRDDYDAFRNAGVPFLFLTSGVSRFYHKAGDVPAIVDPARIAAAARVAVEAVARVDAREEPLPFAKEPVRDDRTDVTEVLALIEAALDPKCDIKFRSETEKKALASKRDRVKDLLRVKGPLSARDRGTLKDALELLLLLLSR